MSKPQSAGNFMQDSNIKNTDPNFTPAMTGTNYFGQTGTNFMKDSIRQSSQNPSLKGS